MKETVLLTGASGSMGFETFKLLWERRGEFEIVLFLRPSRANRKLFRPYVGEIRIVWGDALNRSDVERACEGIDICLHPMALISPEADRNPELAYKINEEATRAIVEAIEAQDPEHIRLVYIGTIAEYGDRLPPVHVGRCGDPVIPSVFDHYALSKIGAELAVMQSRIKHRVSLRQTFIMVPELFSLKDPIMFHQPISSFMENITARDSGRLLTACLDVPQESEFWGQYFNIGGGPACRTTFLDFLDRIYSMLGIRYEKAMERRWFALKNFHMQFFEDSERLNHYLKHWEGGQDLEEYYQEVWNNLPVLLKISARLAKVLPLFRTLMERITRMELRRLAQKEDGTLHWYREAVQGKPDARLHMEAFFGSTEAMEGIPAWGENMPSLDLNHEFRRLDHGYDEEKSTLDASDLEKAAAFRGGRWVGTDWKGDWHAMTNWECGLGHHFSMTPHALLKGGHGCPECIAPPWNYQDLAARNPFAAQVLQP